MRSPAETFVSAVAGHSQESSCTFGPFVFEPAAERLRRDGVPVPLSNKAMAALQLLVDRRPRVVKRQELFDTLWPDVIVVEANLRNVMHELRCALDDHEREGRFLRTVHGRGYAFVADVTYGVADVGSPWSGVLVLRGREYLLRDGPSLVGRAAPCDVLFYDRSVSRVHARIVIAHERVIVEDLRSKNGTYVDGRRLTGQTAVCDGSAITFGSVSGVIRVTPSEETTLSGLAAITGKDRRTLHAE